MNLSYQPKIRLAVAIGFFVLGGDRLAKAHEFFPLGDLPGSHFSSRARSVNDNGTVVVGTSATLISGNDSNASYIWTKAEGMINIGDHAFAEAVSSDGNKAVGGVSDSLSITPFIWTPTNGLVSLGLPPGETPSGASVAIDISGDGTVIVGSTQFDRVIQAFRWTDSAGFTNLARPPW